MRIWPIIVDARPSYLGRAQSSPGESCESLLFALLGGNTVLEHLLSSLQLITGNPPIIVPPVGADAGYASRLMSLSRDSVVAETPEQLAAELSVHELSDAWLIIDPRYMPVGGFRFSDIVHHYAADPRVCHHLVAFESAVAGTKERVNVDGAGQIRNIQRFYEQTTWPFVAGILATLIPCACDIQTHGPGLPSLLALRQFLASLGVPSRDVPIDGGVVDLADERGIVAANEHFVLKLAATRDAQGEPALYLGGGQRIDASARLIGPVLVHRDVHIGGGATIIGPSVIGPGAVLEPGAVVAHSIVGSGCVVPAGAVVQDAACFNAVGATEPSQALPFRERLSRLSMDVRSRVTFADPPRARWSWYRGVKRATDFVIGTVSMVLLAPVLALIALAIWFESRGPVLYGDKREGRGGRLFRCWKFRTMHTGAHLAQRSLTELDHTDGPHFKIDHDPRVTKVGRLLRTLNVDELPQLINVVTGEMSLIGPRPSPFRENQVCVPWREARLSVRPGITGFWQVCRHNRSAGDFHQWIEYDLLYVQNLSLWLDVKILLATIVTFGGKASHMPASWLVGSAGERGLAATWGGQSEARSQDSRARRTPRAVVEL